MKAGPLPIGTISAEGTAADDYVQDDSALLYRDETKRFIITGCSHAGICNIVQYANTFPDSGNRPLSGIIGGFHLMKDDRQLRETVAYLKEHVTGTLYPCHCVSLYAKHCLMKEMPVKEVGVGMTLELN